MLDSRLCLQPKRAKEGVGVYRVEGRDYKHKITSTMMQHQLFIHHLLRIIAPTSLVNISDLQLRVMQMWTVLTSCP